MLNICRYVESDLSHVDMGKLSDPWKRCSLQISTVVCGVDALKLSTTVTKTTKCLVNISHHFFVYRLCFFCCGVLRYWLKAPNVTLYPCSCVLVCDSRKWSSGLTGSSSAQRAPRCAGASGFSQGGQRNECVPLKLSAELSQQALTPASQQLFFI